MRLEHLDRGACEGEEGAADAEGHHPLGPELLGRRGQPLQGRPLAGDDHVAGGVVVGHGQDLAEGGALDGHLDPLGRQPQHRAHRPGRRWRPAASPRPAGPPAAGRPRTTAPRPRPGRRTRPGSGRPRTPAAAPPPLPGLQGRHRHAEDRRLGDVGLPQLVGAGCPQGLGQVLPRQALAHWCRSAAASSNEAKSRPMPGA